MPQGRSVVELRMAAATTHLGGRDQSQVAACKFKAGFNPPPLPGKDLGKAPGILLFFACDEG